MKLQHYPWQQRAWQQAQTLLLSRDSGSMLFNANEGNGLEDFILSLAAAVLCGQTSKDGSACGQCRSCVLCHHDNHPDLMVLGYRNNDDSPETISIDDIRELIQWISLTPQIATKRVAVLLPAENCTIAAADAVLKILEEPPSYAHFLLGSYSPERLLKTVRSRCINYRLPACSMVEARTWLESQGVASEQITELLLSSANSPLTALAYFKGDGLHLWQGLIKDLLNWPREMKGLASIVKQWEELGIHQLHKWLLIILCCWQELAASGTDLLEGYGMSELFANFDKGTQQSVAQLSQHILQQRQQILLSSGLDKRLCVEQIVNHLAQLKGS